MRECSVSNLDISERHYNAPSTHPSYNSCSSMMRPGDLGPSTKPWTFSTGKEGSNRLASQAWIQDSGAMTHSGYPPSCRLFQGSNPRCPDSRRLCGDQRPRWQSRVRGCQRHHTAGAAKEAVNQRSRLSRISTSHFGAPRMRGCGRRSYRRELRGEEEQTNWRGLIVSHGRQK